VTTHRAVVEPSGPAQQHPTPTPHRRTEPVLPAWRDRVILAGIALVAAATVVRTVLMNRTWFWFDDYALVNTPAQDGLTGHDLFEPYFSHLMPGGRFLAWLVVQGDPYDYRIAVAEIIVFYAAAGLAMLYLLVVLFGRRVGILVPLVYFLLSPFLTSAMSWWCVGINHVPALLASCMALATHVRYLRSRQPRFLVASLAWIVFGLVFAELALYLYVPMVVLTLGYFASGTLSQRIGHVWSTYREAVVAHALLGATYLVVFYKVAWTTVPAQQTPDWSQFIGNAALTMFPTVAIGGPGTWHTAWSAQFEADPSGLVRLLGLAVTATVVSLAALTRERAMRAWLIPLLQFGLTVGLVGKARVVFGPGIALDVRFFGPLSLGVALAMALAFLPLVDSVESSEERTRHWLLGAAPVAAATVAYAAFAISSANAYPLLHLGDHAPKRWFDAVERTLASRDQPVDLVDATTPEWIMGPPEAYYQRALAQLDGQVRYPTVVQDDFSVFDDEGKLVRPDLKEVRAALAPAPAACGYPVRADRTIPLDGPVLGFGWRVRVAYTAAADSTATISLGDVDTDVSLLRGEHLLELPGDAQYDGVRFSGVDPHARLCVTSLEVGTTLVPGRPATP
jgi:hypothetical protein